MKSAGFTFGLGCGIIFITVIFYIVYSFALPSNANTELTITDEDIVDRATKMGMIFFDELPNAEQAAQMPDDEIIERAYGLGMVFQKSDVIGSEEAEEAEGADEAKVASVDDVDETVYIDVYISPGMSAAEISFILYQNGIVDDADKFLNFVKNRAETKKLKNGNFSLPANGTYEDVLNGLRGRRTSP